VNSQLVDQAIQFAIDHETGWPREVGEHWGIHQFDPPPWNRLLGPVHDRGPVSGTILQDGRRVVSWGEPDRADLTFSVAKTYLALLAGVAHDRGLLPNVREPVIKRVPGIGFDTAHNAGITWEHLLQQTSEWQGECFGVPDTVDRYRTVQFQDIVLSGRKGDARPLSEPGGFWEYNDVRVNQLSLALLHLFGRPLPDILREDIMEPVGASDSWQWIGYDHAWVNIGGTRIQSVPGGSHWGGGLSISSHDQALVGQMLLDGGRVRGRQILSRQWLSLMCAPCAIAPFYGYLLWLNRGRRIFPSAPETSFFAFGAGSSFTWIDPEHHTVVIVRWIDADHADAFFAKVTAALRD
jgi:CubicO group peptidase (beta-lactamase class C family)